MKHVTSIEFKTEEQREGVNVQRLRIKRLPFHRALLKDQTYAPVLLLDSF